MLQLWFFRVSEIKSHVYNFIEILNISVQIWWATTIYYTKRISRSFHSWQTFTFSSWAGVLHLNEVFNVCCFAHFEEDSSIPLMCETAERSLSRTDFRCWSTSTSQVKQNRRLLSAWNFPGYHLACSCGVMLHGFFFGFTFTANLAIFKAKRWKGSWFAAK